MKSGQLQINELRNILNEHFHWYKARLDCFVSMLLALLAVPFLSCALISLRYWRMHRFFREHWIDYNDVAWFIMRLFGFTHTTHTDSDYYLSLDRTNWKWGKTISIVSIQSPCYLIPLSQPSSGGRRRY